MKKILLILSLVIIFALVGCSNSNETSNVKLTVDEIAEKNNATISEFSQAYQTENTTLNFVNIKKYPEYQLNSNEKFKNVVVIENGLYMNDTKKFADEEGYFSVFDEYGNENIVKEVWTQKGREYPEIILVCEKDITTDKYVIVGGYNRDRNDGKDKRLFEIKES